MKSSIPAEQLVSVIMATYNEPPHVVLEAVQSILDQTYANFELFIFDDSTDAATRKAINQFSGDKRVQILRSDDRTGFVPSLNLGLERARGDFIARMDGNDVSHLDRFEKEVAFLQSHPDVYVVGGQINIINEYGKVISTRRYPKGGVMLDLYAGVRSPLAHPAIMMRRTLVDKGFRYDKMSEDLDLWLRVMNGGYKIANMGDFVLDYRVNEGFAGKRTDRRQIEHMAHVRRKNISKRYSVRSIISWSVANLFLHMPVKIIQEAYKIENKQ